VSLCYLCALCVSVADYNAEIDFTTETQRAQRYTEIPNGSLPKFFEYCGASA